MPSNNKQPDELSQVCSSEGKNIRLQEVWIPGLE